MLAKRYNVVQMRQFFSSKSCVRLLSLPMRGEWIEIQPFAGEKLPVGFRSLPMRGEWIEIAPCPDGNHGGVVSPHAGRVD